MSISVDTVNLRFNVKPDYDQQQLQQLQEDLKNGQKELEKTRRAMDKLAKQRFKGFKALADLQSKYYDKFRKNLSARQVEKVLHFDEPFGPKPCCGKHECPKFDGKFDGPRPECGKKHGPHHPEGPKPAPKE